MSAPPPPQQKRAAPKVNRLAAAVKARSLAAVWLALAQFPDEESRNVAPSNMSAIAFLCCESAQPRDWWGGLALLEHLSEGTPAIVATADAVQQQRRQRVAAATTAAQVPGADMEGAPVPFVAPQTVAPNFARFALTEGVASLYLRLLALALAPASVGAAAAAAAATSPDAAVATATPAGASVVMADGCSQLLEVAYRFLIRSLAGEVHRQTAAAQTSNEMKKFRVRRRFFSPVLTLAAQAGLPRLCVEVLDSVADGTAAATTATTDAAATAGAAVAAEATTTSAPGSDGAMASGMGDPCASGMMGRLLSTATGERENGDDDDDDDALGADDEDDNDDEAPPPRVRQRRTGDGADDDATKRSHHHEGATAPSNKAAARANNSNEHSPATEVCELWEADFAAMVAAVTRRIQCAGSTATVAVGVDVAAYLDRILVLVGTSLPLVGRGLSEALLELGRVCAAVASNATTELHSSTLSATVRVTVAAMEAPIAERTLCETVPCVCTACRRPCGGAALEMTRESAAALAAAIREKLIVHKLRARYGEGTQRFCEAVASFEAFEKLGAALLDPAAPAGGGSMVVIVDGANIGLYGVRAWYPRVKREVMRRRNIPASEWDVDELDIMARRDRGIHTDIAPSFAQIACAIDKAQQHFGANVTFVVVLHARHVAPAALAENMNNAEIHARWAASSSSSSSSSPRVVVAASPRELNDDWCWMHMALSMCAQTYLSESDHCALTAPSSSSSSSSSSQQQQQQPRAPAPLSRPVVLLTNDLLRDHVSGLMPGKAEAGWQFLRFRWLHQVKCSFSWSAPAAIAGGGDSGTDARGRLTVDNAILRFPPRFHTWPERREAPSASSPRHRTVSWHIPFTHNALAQGTAKAGLPVAAAASKAAMPAAGGDQQQQPQPQQQQPQGATTPTAGVARLPEQLLDMLSFAGSEAKGRMLCVAF